LAGAVVVTAVVEGNVDVDDRTASVVEDLADEVVTVVARLVA
jgi:hypothetical protein